eukprot:403372398
MQPYPLRIDMNRIKSEGDYAKNAPDLRKNFVKFLKYNTVQSYMEKTGQDTPKFDLKMLEQVKLRALQKAKEEKEKSKKIKQMISEKRKSIIIEEMDEGKSKFRENFMTNRSKSQMSDHQNYKQSYHTKQSQSLVTSPMANQIDQRQFFNQRHRKNASSLAYSSQVSPYIIDQQSDQQKEHRTSSNFKNYNLGSQNVNPFQSIQVEPFSLRLNSIQNSEDKQYSRSNVLSQLQHSQTSSKLQALNSINQPSIKTLEDQYQVDNIIYDCKQTSKGIRSDSKKYRKHLKSINRYFFDFKRRLNFNIQQNQQAEEIIPDDLVAIKEKRVEFGGVPQGNKQIQKILQDAQEQRDIQKQENKVKNQGRISIRLKNLKNSQISDNGITSGGDTVEQKSPSLIVNPSKLSINYSKKELHRIMQDKEFIDIYKDFNLLYLKECINQNKEQKKEIKKSIRDFHVENEKKAFRSLRR